MNQEEKFYAKMLKLYCKKAIYIYIYLIAVKFIQFILMVCLQTQADTHQRLVLIGIKLGGTWLTLCLCQEIISQNNQSHIKEFNMIIHNHNKLIFYTILENIFIQLYTNNMDTEESIVQSYNYFLVYYFTASVPLRKQDIIIRTFMLGLPIFIAFLRITHSIFQSSMGFTVYIYTIYYQTLYKSPNYPNGQKLNIHMLAQELKYKFLDLRSDDQNENSKNYNLEGVIMSMHLQNLNQNLVKINHLFHNIEQLVYDMQGHIIYLDAGHIDIMFVNSNLKQAINLAKAVNIAYIAQNLYSQENFQMGIGLVYGKLYSKVVKYSLRTFKIYYGESLQEARKMSKRLISEIGIDLKSFKKNILPPVEYDLHNKFRHSNIINFEPNFKFYKNSELNLILVKVWEPIRLKFSLQHIDDSILELEQEQSSISQSQESVFNHITQHDVSGFDENSFSNKSQQIIRQNSINPYSLGVQEQSMVTEMSNSEYQLCTVNELEESHHTSTTEEYINPSQIVSRTHSQFELFKNVLQLATDVLSDDQQLNQSELLNIDQKNKSENVSSKPSKGSFSSQILAAQFNRQNSVQNQSYEKFSRQETMRLFMHEKYIQFLKKQDRFDELVNTSIYTKSSMIYNRFQLFQGIIIIITSILMLIQYGLVLNKDNQQISFHLFIVMTHFSREELNNNLKSFVLTMIVCQFLLLIYGANQLLFSESQLYKKYNQNVSIKQLYKINRNINLLQIIINLLYYIFSLVILMIHLWIIKLHTYNFKIHISRFIQLEIIFILFQINAIICPLIQNMSFVLKSAKYSLIISITFCIAIFRSYTYSSITFLLTISSQYEEMFQTYLTSINNHLDIKIIQKQITQNLESQNLNFTKNTITLYIIRLVHSFPQLQKYIANNGKISFFKFNKIKISQDLEFYDSVYFQMGQQMLNNSLSIPLVEMKNVILIQINYQGSPFEENDFLQKIQYYQNLFQSLHVTIMDIGIGQLTLMLHASNSDNETQVYHLFNKTITFSFRIQEAIKLKHMIWIGYGDILLTCLCQHRIKLGYCGSAKQDLNKILQYNGKNKSLIYTTVPYFLKMRELRSKVLLNHKIHHIVSKKLQDEIPQCTISFGHDGQVVVFEK